jgi:UTP--glucose-1-phosphate uridylyltransferase
MIFMSERIRKVIIPVAGYGTRFLPATKAQPKEMLPVVDKPVLQYIVEEAVASGIEDIIMVTSATKRAVEDHFDHSTELEAWLEKQGKTEALNEVRQIAELANFIFLRQKGPYGNGTPILNARHLIGDEPFAVIWGDEPIFSKTPRLKQLIEVYEQRQGPVLTGYEVDDEGTTKYGILSAHELAGNVYQVDGIVEKPGPEAAPSRLAALGGYVLTPDIFDLLAETNPGRDGEIWLVDAIAKLLKKRPVYACKIEGTYYDLGSKLGWLEANVSLGLRHPELAEPFRKYLQSIV